MGRFDWRFELRNIYDGIQHDLQDPVGQTVPWYVFDPVLSVVDPIYDVGSVPSGRRWKPPIFLPVASAIKLEGEEISNDRGFYVLDTLQVIFTADVAQKVGLGDLILSPTDHNLDRIVYENKVFAVDQVRVRGVLKAGYAICAASCKQVKPEELVNDPQFQDFITDPTEIGNGMATPTYPLSIEAGADFTETFIYSQVTDLTGWTARLEIKDKVGGTSYKFLSTANGGITFVGNSVIVAMTSTATSALANTLGVRGVYDIELVKPDGGVVRLIKGEVLVDPEVTTST